jgi:hypothetical protein
MNPVTSLWYGVDSLSSCKTFLSGMNIDMGNPLKFLDLNGLFEKKSQAIRFSKHHENAMVLQDSHTKQWFVAMDASSSYFCSYDITRF